MAAIDYNALRAQTLGSGNDEEAVTVNTRALIDKVLARYSGEWTTLRELLQNAADASASKVKIKFETLPSSRVPLPASQDSSSMLKHAISHHTLGRLIVTNNGQPFATSDWSRLKRIAEGNPDETKIGAFGVGFYSVFADCEEPFVSSGKEAMAFYWKGNSLFTRRLQLSDEHRSTDTSFVLDYRTKTSAVPNLLNLCQFLATSLTFVGLQCIELHIDDWNIITLIKKGAPSSDVALPREVGTKTRDGIFTVNRVNRQNVQIDANYMSIVDWKPSQGFNFSSVTAALTGNDRLTSANNSGAIRNWFSRLSTIPIEDKSSVSKSIDTDEQKRSATEDQTELKSATVFLRINTAHVKTSVTASFAKELERATKKPPPKSTTLAILTSSHDEMLASTAVENKGGENRSIFATVLPTKSGRIFIGFPTHQTTGIQAHIAANSVIPTVERESIDLNARWVRDWNAEMLRVAGILCRITWSSEMNEIQSRLDTRIKASGNNKVTPEQIAATLPEALHLFRQFSFKDSTPSSTVAQIIEESFWTCNKKASIEVFSTRGVLPSHQVRISTEDLSFVEGVPLLPEELVQKASELVDKFVDYHLISGVTTTDIKSSLTNIALSEKQLEDFLRWIGRKAVSKNIDAATVKGLLEVAIASDESPDGTNQGMILLESIRRFVIPSRIPVDVPLPPDVMKFKYTKNMSKSEMEALGWQELHVVPWLRFLLAVDGGNNLDQSQNLTSSPEFAARILPVISRQWDSLGQSSQATVTSLLAERTVIPTRLGMYLPKLSYFPSVKIFTDLPVIKGLNGVKERFLVALGVRKTVALNVIFERLTTEDNQEDDKDGKWSHVDLIKYLGSVKDDIPNDDIRRLKETPLCPSEIDGKPGTKLFKVQDLFEPKESLRSLGFPLLYWPGVFRLNSIEGRLLKSLGLRLAPTVEELIHIMEDCARKKEYARRERALQYFLQSFQTNNYRAFDMETVKTPFLPVEAQGNFATATPSGCFLNQDASILGYQILRKDLHEHSHKLGVQRDPPISDCVNRLLKAPPRDRNEAVEFFGYFGTRLAVLDQSHLDRLGTAEIVPLNSKAQVNDFDGEKSTLRSRRIAPRSCYLGSSATYGNIFDFVNFGQHANLFLLKCGSKIEPTKQEIARLLVRDPARLLEEFNSAEKYLELLRTLAEISRDLKRDKTLWSEMKRARFLLASREVERDDKRSSKAPKQVESEALDDSENSTVREWTLSTASEIVIVDDFISYSLFRDQLLAAPQEETLETFYQTIGAKLLSELVEEDPKISSPVEDVLGSEKLRKLIVERSHLFLYDYPTDARRYSAAWVEKNLNVHFTRSIKLRRTLKGKNLQHMESRSAAVTYGSQRGWVLWVTSSAYDMFQVSQALVNLLLVRPKAHSTMMLEMLLTTDLLKLRTRGYNVDRILKAKAAEARIAEQKRQKQREEETKHLELQQQEWEAARANGEQNRQIEKEMKIPGAFGSDSPEPAEQPPPYSGNGALQPGSAAPQQSILSSISKNLGIGNADENSIPQNNIRVGGKPTSNGLSPESSAPTEQSTSTQVTRKPNTNNNGAMTSPQALQSTLTSAIQASRPHGSSSIFSRPTTSSIKEESSYCDETPGHDISFVGNTPVGIKIFLSNSLPSRSTYFHTHSVGIARFALVLHDCATVYNLQPESLHIFADDSGSSIAFNRAGALFANYRFFNQLHFPSFGDSPSAEARTNALVYWVVVLAHELAHNLVGDHSAAHSYYTESLVVEYYPRVLRMIASYGDGDAASGITDRAPKTAKTAAATTAAASAFASASPPPQRQQRLQSPPPPPLPYSSTPSSSASTSIPVTISSPSRRSAERRSGSGSGSTSKSSRKGWNFF